MSIPRLTAAALLASLTKAPLPTLLPQDVGASANGTAVDLTAVTRAIGVITVAAASTSTNFTFLWEDSVDGLGSWVTVPAGNLPSGQPAVVNDDAAGNHNKVIYTPILVQAARKFVRCSAAGAGGTPALLASAVIIPGPDILELSPYELEQIQYALNRRAWDHGSGEPPSGQPSLRTILSS